MTSLFRILCFLGLLSSLVLIGVAFNRPEFREGADCCSGDSGYSFSGITSLWGGPAESFFSWEKFLNFIGWDSGGICAERKRSYWKYVRKRRYSDDDDPLIDAFCGVSDWVAKGGEWAAQWLWTKPSPKSNQLFDWMTSLGQWIYMWFETFSDWDFGHISSGIFGTMAMVLEGSTFKVAYSILVAFGIWRLSGYVYHRKGGTPTGQTADSKPRRIPTAMMKVIASRYVALELIKSCVNFHTFLLQCKSNGRSVLMRCLRSEASRSAKIGLAREQRALTGLKHRNIIRVVDWIRTGYTSCLGLEYAKFGNLQMALSYHRSNFRLIEKIAVFRQIVRAVAYLHRAGMAHLNIRAKTIAVFQKWSLVKLAGFDHVIKTSRKRLSNRFDLHPSSVPADVLFKRELYDPYKVDSWALGSLFLFLLNGDVQDPSKGPDCHMLSTLQEGDARCRRIIQDLISDLLSSEPRRRPSATGILFHLDKLDK